MNERLGLWGTALYVAHKARHKSHRCSLMLDGFTAKHIMKRVLLLIALCLRHGFHPRQGLPALARQSHCLSAQSSDLPRRCLVIYSFSQGHGGVLVSRDIRIVRLSIGAGEQESIRRARCTT